jgi:hypothetical protein
MRSILTSFLVLLFACAANAADSTKIVFIAGGPSHGFGAHDHLAGCHLLANKLKEAMPGYDAVVSSGWPKDSSVLENAFAVVIYCDGGPRHLAVPHIRELDQLSKKGVGIGCIHYAVEVTEDEGGEWWLKWMGGYFEINKSVNPHWTAKFEKLPDHPVTRGVKPFTTNDEWYYNMHFRDGMKGVTPILSAVPPDSTRQGKDDPHGGNPEVRAAIGKHQQEHVMWVSENANASRGFGLTGAHFHWNWAQDDFRKCVLNAVVWIAKGEVPTNGVESKRPTMDEMLQNHDEKIPDKFDRAATEKMIEEMNKPFSPAKS